MKHVFIELIKLHENASMGAVGAGAIASTAMPFLGQKKRKKKSPVRRRTKSNLEEATTTPYLFHATFTEKVPSIMKRGLRQYLGATNWVKAGTGKRYNEDAGIFAFEHPEDAFKWAFKMNWEFKQDISIVRIKLSDVWEQDPSTDFSLMGKGRSMRSPSDIPTSDIIDVFHMKDFGVPAERGISADEWIADSAEKMMS